MKTNNNFSFFGDLMLPVLVFFASLPFLIVLGILKGIGNSCNHMTAWHAKDYIQKHW
jgi:hypothetical protein